jgi:hypothetical protein
VEQEDGVKLLASFEKEGCTAEVVFDFYVDTPASEREVDLMARDFARGLSKWRLVEVNEVMEED